MPLVSVVVIAVLLALLAWPSVEPRIASLLRRRRRRANRYFRD